MSALQLVASRSGFTEAKVYRNHDRRSQRLTLGLRDRPGSYSETRQMAWLETPCRLRGRVGEQLVGRLRELRRLWRRLVSVRKRLNAFLIQLRNRAPPPHPGMPAPGIPPCIRPSTHTLHTAPWCHEPRPKGPLGPKLQFCA